MTIAARSMARHVTVGRQRAGRAALLAASIALIAGLTAVTAADGPRSLAVVGQICFVLVFSALAVLDLRCAAALALLELVIGGSNGQWTTFPGGFHGRLVLDGIVMLRAAGSLMVGWRRTRTLDLGRYGPHAAFLAVAMPAVWMTLGLINGNAPRDVFSDGNAEIFFAFTLVVVVLVKSGHGAWLRNWLLVCCALNAMVICGLFVVAVAGLVPAEPTLREILWDRLGMGNAIGYVENGAFRLYLASGLYLQIGVAIAGSLLLANWRRPWVWALMGLLVAALIATYTRGFWVGAAVALLVVLGLGSRNLVPPIRVLGGLLLMIAAASAVGYSFGFSLPDYVLNRAASISETDVQAPGMPASSPTNTPQAGARPVATPTAPPPGSDTSGPISNAIRVVQGRILLAHIAERPILGWGFGAIAPDYPYGLVPNYELAFLDLAFKTGLIGLALWLSFPVRLLIAFLLARLRRIRLPDGLPPEAAGVPIAIIASILVVGATSSYILASYGLLPIIWAVAWLEPSPSQPMSAEPHPGTPS